MAFATLATAYGLVVPVFESPDEHTHYFVGQHIAQTGRLPVQSKARDDRGPWEQEGSQPPLYYVLIAPLVWLGGADLEESDLRYNHQNTMGEPWHHGNENRFVHDPSVEGWPWHGYALSVHLARLFSTLLAAVAVAALWALARTVVPERPWIAWAAAALFALNPQHLHLAGSLTNDNLTNALAALTLWLLARMLDGATDRPTRYGLALAVGLAPLAKLSGLALLGFAGLTLMWVTWRRRDLGLFVRTVVPLTAAAIVLSGWWYARNIMLYGSLTGLDFMLPEGIRRDFNPERWRSGLPAELYGLWRSSWGLFGWFTIMLPEWMYRVIELLSVAGLFGVILAAWRRIEWVRWPRLVWLVLWWALAFGSLLRWLTIAKGAHGRLLFPAIAAAVILLLIGWRVLAPRRMSDRFLALGVAGMVFAFAVASFVGWIRPAYAYPTALPADTNLGPETLHGATFDDSLRLVSAQHPLRVTEGGEMPIRLNWRLLEPPSRDGLVAIRFDQTIRRKTIDSTVASTRYETVTEAGPVYLAYHGRGTTPPDLLSLALGSEQEQPLFADEHFVPVPLLESTYLRNGSYLKPMPIAARVSVHMYDGEKRESWPAVVDGDEGAQDVGQTIVIDPVKRFSRSDTPVASPAARFDGAGTSIAMYEFYRWSPPDSHLDMSFNLSSAPGTPLTDYSGREYFADLKVRYQPIKRAPVRGSGAEPRYSKRVMWEASGPAEAITLFAHMVDEDGNVVAQFDGEPTSHASYPSRFWRTGEVLVSDILWDLPPDAVPEETYTLLVGLYQRVDGTPRLSATATDGSRFPNDAIPMVEVIYSPDAR